MIYLRQVTKYCKAGKDYFRAIDDVSLGIEDGEFAAVLGPSGSGKSVLLKLMGGWMHPSEGSVLVQNERLQDLKRRKLEILRRRNIGFVAQNPSFPDKTALRTVLAQLKPFKVVGDKAAYGRTILKKVGLAGKEENKWSELSAGETQRLAVAAALITQPKIILADEPVSVLDEDGKMDIMELFYNLNREGKTIVMATQDAKLASLTKRVIRLHKGRLEENMEPPAKNPDIKEESLRIITEIE